MTPMEAARKWADVAEKALNGCWDRNSIRDQDVVAFVERIYAHYGTRVVGSLAHSDVYAVATVEAMNEWQLVKDAPTCMRCDSPILPGQTVEGYENPTDYTDFQTRHADRTQCK